MKVFSGKAEWCFVLSKQLYDLESSSNNNRWETGIEVLIFMRKNNTFNG